MYSIHLLTVRDLVCFFSLGSTLLLSRIFSKDDPTVQAVLMFGYYETESSEYLTRGTRSTTLYPSRKYTVGEEKANEGFVKGAAGL